MKIESSSSAKRIDVAPGIGIGGIAANWQPIAAAPLLILIGVTGVGKSTTVEAMRTADIHFTLLPNRRELTDQLIISQMQRLDGETLRQVTDRQARFDYTRGYRERYPGGMARALSQLQVDPGQLDGLLLFDGLRGVNEVSYAATHLPAACFIVLDAPDVVRVQRLLGRNDAFDQIKAARANPDDEQAHDFAGLGVPAARQIFSVVDETALLRLVHSGAVTAGDLAAKLRIVVTERRNYDPDETIATLRALAPERTVVIDTVNMTPDQGADEISRFIVNGQIMMGYNRPS